MSTILKALRRLEHEKSSQAERPLREQVASAPVPKRGVSRTLAVGGVFGVGIALGVAALLLWPEPATQLAARPEASGVAAGVAAGGPPARSGARAQPEAAPRAASTAPAARPADDLPTEALESAVEVVEHPPAADENVVIELTATPKVPGPPPEGLRPAAEAMKPQPHYRPPGIVRQRTRTLPVAENAPAERPEPVGAPPPVVSEAPPSSPTLATLPPGVRVAAADRPAPPPSDAVEAAPPPHRVADQARPATPAVPEITPRIATPPTAPPEPSPAPVAAAAPAAPPAPTAPASDVAVGEILVERTLWHPVPDKRVAVVDVEGHPEPLRVHEGDLVGSLVVRTIEPSGVVFLRDGVEVRRSVGHSH